MLPLKTAQFRLTIGFRRAVKWARFQLNEITLKYSKHVDCASIITTTLSLVVHVNTKICYLSERLLYTIDFPSSECRLRTGRSDTVVIVVKAIGQG